MNAKTERPTDSHWFTNRMICTLPRTRVYSRPFAVVSAIAAQLCFAAIETGEPISLGVLLGGSEAERASLLHGATLGIESANARLGTRARLVQRGRPGQWGVEGDEAVALALDDAVQGIITPSGGTAAHQVLQVAGRTRVPVVSLCPDSSITGAGIPWAVRIVPRTDEQARAIFAGLTHPRRSAFLPRQPSTNPSIHISKTPLIQPLSWAVIVPDERAGREVLRDLTKAAEESECQLKERIQLPPNRGDWKQICQRLAASRPDAILVWHEPAAAGQLTRDLRAAGFDGLLTGPAILRSKTFQNSAGAAADGFIIPVIAPSVESEARRVQFATAYHHRHDAEPDFWSAMAHDAVWLLMGLAENGGTQPGPVTSQKFHGATGYVRFDQKGNRVVTLTLAVCHKGEFWVLQ